MSPKNSVRVVQGATYASLTVLVEALVNFLLPVFGLHVPPLVTVALISLLVGGGTLTLHEMGIVVPGAPSDFGLQQMLSGLIALLEQQGWQPPPAPDPPPPPVPPPPTPPAPVPPPSVQGS